MLLAGLLAVGALPGSGCPRRQAGRALERPTGPPPRPRIRFGKVLRLKRAGILRLIRGGKRAGVAALVPTALRAGGWQRAIDSQGNQFRVSPGGLIITDGEPHPDREPASTTNVAYYYTQSYALMAGRYRRQGLKMAAEVLDLPSRDTNVQIAQRSLCALFDHLGIKGPVRDKLYRNLAGVAHRVPGGARQTNHVHGFAVTVPLRWQVMAGSVPKLGKLTTVMVFALPGRRQDPAAVAANLVWATRTPPASTSLAVFARTRLLTTAGSRIRQGTWKPPAELPRAVVYEVDPVKYRGRSLRSLQIFFTSPGAVHHLNLLTAPSTDAAAQREALAQVLRTFVVRRPPNRCLPGT